MMVQLKFMFLIVLWIVPTVYAGITLDTIVQTPGGFKKIQDLNVGDQVISLDSEFKSSCKSILTVEEKEIDHYIEIVMENDESLKISEDQRLFVAYKWIQANQLSLSDLLLRADAKFVRIKSICVKYERIMLRFITVADYENFLASQNCVVIHNGPIAGAIGYWFTKIFCYGTAVAAISTVAVSTGGLAGAALGATTAAATLGASTGATVLGGAIVGAGLASEAAVATAAVASSSGGMVGAVAAVESASTIIGAILTLCPFLP